MGGAQSPSESLLWFNEDEQPFHCSLTLTEDTPGSRHCLNEREHEGSVGVVTATGQLKADAEV